MRLAVLRWTALTASALALAACEQATPQGTTRAPPPPKVTVMAVKAQTVPLTRELVGRLAAVRTAQVRARVPGIVLKQVYTEGTDVKAGDVLFQIDPAQLEATLHA
jgi:membrane fusion protein (multidrug efflux system)